MRDPVHDRSAIPGAARLACVLLCAASPGHALAQNFSVSLTNAPALQDIVTGTTSTTFTVSNAGVVTVSPVSSAAAVRVKSGAVTVPTLTLTCTRQGGSSSRDCQGSAITVRVSAGAATGGANVGAFTCAAGQAQPAGVSYTCANGSSSGTAYRDFVYTYGSGANQVGWTSTIRLGLTLVVPASATRATASIPGLCTRVAGASDSFSTGGCGTIVSARILRAIALSRSADLRFGAVIRPGSGSGGVAVSASGARSASGLASFAPGSTAANAAFEVAGEGGQAINVTVPASFTLTNGTHTLTVTTSNDLPGGTSAQTLDGILGSDATLSIGVGGSLPLSPATAGGNYTGSFTVTASYQ
jgi:hypothetical protein